MSEIKIHVFHCGEVGVDPAVPFRDVSKNPVAYTGLLRSSKKRIWLPVSVYLIEHPNGLVLYDTGWHRDVRTNPVKHESWKLHFASKPKLPAGKAIDEQIKAAGFNIGDIEYVLLSHLDVDHASGLRLVKDAKHILISEDEYIACQSRQVRYYSGLWEGLTFETFKLSDSKYGPVNKAFDVFGDEKLLMVFTPGHSQGSCAMLVQNNEKFVLLTGDTGYAPSSWEHLRMPGPVYDKEYMIKSLKWVREMSQKENCIEVLANHDPKVKPHVIEL
jgi:glyoxylase-like metal-dependent hydrolase (beta-lactamase superfamily II)